MNLYRAFLLGMLSVPALWVFFTAFGIVRRALRDTFKWRFRHVKSGHPKCVLFAYYPVLFWQEMKRQCAAWWHGYEHTSSPVEPS